MKKETSGQGSDELIPTRKSLIDRLANGQDQASWQEFFDTYWKFIYGIARKSQLADAEAQDVVQDTLVTVAKLMPNFKYDPAVGEFKGWLATITRSRIVDQVRKRGKHVPLQPIDDNSTNSNDVVDKATQQFDKLWDAEWNQNVLEVAKARVRRRVDPQQYQLFDYYVTKDWPAQKVADHFGVHVDHVYMAKHRVSEKICEEIKKIEGNKL